MAPRSCRPASHQPLGGLVACARTKNRRPEPNTADRPNRAARPSSSPASPAQAPATARTQQESRHTKSASPGPQNLRLFANMTARENVLVRRHCRPSTSPRRRQLHPGERELRAAPSAGGPAAKGDELARNLPYGDSAGWRSPAPWPPTQTSPAGRADRQHEPPGTPERPRWCSAAPSLSIVVIEHDMKFLMDLGPVTVLDHAKAAEACPARSSGTQRSSSLPREGGVQMDERARRQDIHVFYGNIEPSRACPSTSTTVRSSR